MHFGRIFSNTLDRPGLRLRPPIRHKEDKQHENRKYVHTHLSGRILTHIPLLHLVIRFDSWVMVIIKRTLIENFEIHQFYFYDDLIGTNEEIDNI